MPPLEITGSELIRAMADVGTMLTGPKSFDERMTGLCEAAAAVLNCSHLAMMERDGDAYRGAYQTGLPAHVAAEFHDFRVPRVSSHAKAIEQCDNYVLLNSTQTPPEIQRMVELTGSRSMVFVPFIYPDGAPLGYMAVCYKDDRPTVTTHEAELASAIARLAQTTILRDIETQRRREISQVMLQVADSERRRLSRDIHDDPLQRILGLRIGLEGFRQKLTDPEQRSSVDAFITQCRSASASLREVMLRTHPNASELADLEQVLIAMVERRDDSSPITLRFADDRSTDSPPYLIPALNRIAEQAARNTLRHAQASVLTVTLSSKSDGTLLTVADDGTGFDQGSIDYTRLGLVSMRERTELLDGTFSIDSRPGSGTVVTAWFPHAGVDDSAPAAS